MSWPRSIGTSATATPADSAARAVEAAIAEHYPFVWRVLRRLGLTPSDAEDAAQQVFMIAARKLEGIEPDKVRAFLYGTAVRVASNTRRGISRRREAPSLQGEALERVMDQEGLGPEEIAEVRKARALLEELLSELPDKLRRVLVLVEIEQLEIREVATLEGIPMGTVGSRLRLARERFRTVLAAAEKRNPFGGTS